MSKFNKEASIVVDAIRHMANNEEALENFEIYLSYHFHAWLENFANTPGAMACEINDFAHMFD